MQLREKLRMAGDGVFASRFSLLSNVVAVTTGLVFLGLLLALTLGIGEFLERYYTRTMSLTTLLVFQAPDEDAATPFDADFRKRLTSQRGVSRLVYHDIGFGDLSVMLGRTTTVTLRSGIEEDPEISRLERMAGTNLPETADPTSPPIILSLRRAQRLSDLPPAELIGQEIAIEVQRSLTLDDEAEVATIYGTVAGIVNETPDDSAYVDYRVLAMLDAWKSDLADIPAVEEDSSASSVAPTASDSEVEPAEESVAAGADDCEVISQDTTGDATTKSESDPRPAPDTVTRVFRHGSVQDAWAAIRVEFEKDVATYPHLRVHVSDTATLAAVRSQFHKAGLETHSVMDDVAAIRELRRFGLIVGSVLGLVTLVAATCSIFNTLLASVERRTREIGILRALGASTFSLLSVFLLEAIFLSLIGAMVAALVLRLLTGFGNSFLTQYLSQNPEFKSLVTLQPNLFLLTPSVFATILAVSVVTALVAGFVPAVRACRINPATALRHE